MTARELREHFLQFFRARGHTVVPSSSLIPDDPSVLLTTAGMQQFKPYYTRAADPFVSPHEELFGKPLGSRNAASCQKSFRTSDIDEVGDERHLTFFEMLGNFSFGGYFKADAIKYAYDFLHEIDLSIDYVTVFGGESTVPADIDSERIWKEIDASLEVKKCGRDDNFWGPTGSEGPCGPSTEIYSHGIEIWNIVFNEYYQHTDGTLKNLQTCGVDTGMGLERLAMVCQNKRSVFETDLFEPLLSVLSSIADNRQKRIIADHARAIAFLISDGVRPSNKEAGYVLRRLIRRVVAYKIPLVPVLEKVIDEYGPLYSQLQENVILSEFLKEETKFQTTLDRGLRKLAKEIRIDAKKAFSLYETYGLPFEVMKEMGGEKAINLSRMDFEKEFQNHQEISRAGQERKFGGHGLLLDTGELKAANEEELKIVTMLHTATHLLQAALRKALGENIHQAGSDITAERTRFDFTFDRKLTKEELMEVEDLVNKAIEDDLVVHYEEMPYETAVRTGALHFTKVKYPPTVKVYTMNSKYPEPFSKELCGGPHVHHTGELGHFKILKEEGVAAGIRRVRATLIGKTTH